MYTDAKAVGRILGERRKNHRLAKEVLDYLGGRLPDGWPADKPIATINRYMATARVEDIVFSHAARSIGLRPFWPTYLDEQFTITNPEKVSCLRPTIQRPKQQVTRSWLTRSHQSLEGKPLGEIRLGGNGLQDIHQEVRDVVLESEVAGNVFDISAWNTWQAQRFGHPDDGSPKAKFYYTAVMALYVCNGVLFEDFDDGPNVGTGLGQFVSSVIRSAFEEVTSLFGMQPLVVRMPYSPGFINFPSASAATFDRYRE